jgi:hypothetical protein
VTAITLSKGDIGVVVAADGTIHPLLPNRTKSLSPKHIALIGAAFQVQNDPPYALAAAKAFELYHTPQKGHG